MQRTWRAVVFAAFLSAAACSQQTAPPAADQSETAPAPSAAQNGQPLIFCDEVGRRVSQEDCDDFNALARDAAAGVAAFNRPNEMKRGETHTLQLAISYAPPEIQLTPSANEQGATTTATTAEEDQEQTDAGEAPPPPSPAPADDGTATGDVTNGPAAPGAASGSGAHPSRSRTGAGAPRQLSPSETVENLPGSTVQFTPLVGRFMKAELTGVGFDITPQSPATQEVQKDSVTTWSWRVVAREGGVRSLTLTTVVEGCTTADHQDCIPLRTTTQNYTVNVAVGPLDRVRDFLSGVPDWLKLITGVIVALTSLIAAVFGLRAAIRKGRSGDA